MARMEVYCGSKTPFVVETNIAWALPYWTKRKLLNPKITWRIK